jgi:hypothetical protein
LVYAGLFAGMMVSTKLTTVYYWVAIAVAIPVLISLPVEPSKKWSLARMRELGTLNLLKSVSAFLIPSAIIGTLFPLLIFTKTNEAVMGIDWIINGLTGNSINSWIDPFYRIFYNNFTRYSTLFVSNPDLPYCYAGIKKLLSYYLVNPFQTHFGSSLSIFSHSPISLLISFFFPVYMIFSKKTDYCSKLLALTLGLGYILKVISYPLLEPPKSEIFHLLPVTILLSLFINKSLNADIIKEETSNIKNVTQHNGKKRMILTSVIIILLPLVYINAYRMKDVYSDIKSNMFASTDKMAARFNQKWFIDNLSNEDVLFGRKPNEICYITKPKVIPFFWEAMYFVPWEVIEKRINNLNVSVIYDSSLPPNVVRAQYDKLMPIIKQRDRHLFNELGKIFVLYENNYLLKNRFLGIYYTSVNASDLGVIYKRKVN